MQRWFQESLELAAPLARILHPGEWRSDYQQWLVYLKQPGVRCVDETTYCIDGIKYWLWVATSDSVCALLLAPTRSSAELEQLLGEDLEGILSSDCFSAYGPQSAAAKQKCLADLERDLEALKTSRFAGNREFASRVDQVLWAARCIYRDDHAGKLSIEAITSQRRVVESQLQEVLDKPVAGGWPFPLPNVWPTVSNVTGQSGSPS
jgi:hypothetical protein